MFISIDILVLAISVFFLLLCWGHAAWLKNYQARKLLLRMNDMLFDARRLNTVYGGLVDTLLEEKRNGLR